MPMSYQDTVQPFESHTRLHDLSLSAFAAIHQETIFVVDNHLRGKPTPDGRRRCRSAEKDDFEQCKTFRETFMIWSREILPHLAALYVRGLPLAAIRSVFVPLGGLRYNPYAMPVVQNALSK